MSDVQMIPIREIRLINPRVRSKVKFREIVGNIAKIGLKRPITVSRRAEGEDGYDLVCGQGRLEAYLALGQTEVPALVVDVPAEDRYLMSLVENLARRTGNPMELMRQIGALETRGYSSTEIAAKVDLSDAYVRGILRLLRAGEERLLIAVHRGEVPMALAIEIASTDDVEMQRKLHEAYDSGALRGNAVTKVRRLIELRRTKGKGTAWARKSGSRAEPGISAGDLVRTLQRDAERQKLQIKRAQYCEQQLLCLSAAVRELLGDGAFAKLLKGESLDKLPKYLAEEIKKR